MQKEYIANQIENKFQRVLANGYPEITDFLDPAETLEAEHYWKKRHKESNFSLYGGPENAERKRMIIAPLGYEPEAEDYEMFVIEAVTPGKQKEITHRDVLGALMGSGIRREKVGDIILLPDGALIIADKKIALFIADNFPMIKSNQFTITLHQPEDYHYPETAFTEKVVTISSFRLDAIIQKAYHMSRSEAQKFITAGKVKVNHIPVEKTDYQVPEDSTISVRTKGRLVMEKSLGKTKKDNIRVLIKIY